MAKDTVTKYLVQYAESEVSLLASYPEKFYQHVLIVPAYNEATEFIDQYLNGQFASLLIILVLNQPEQEVDDSLQQHLYQHLLKNSQQVWSEKHLSLHQCSDPSSDILCIKRYEQGLTLKNKQAVGQARKIAADCALQLIHAMRIKSSWIASTDADSRLTDNYFQQISRYQDHAALTFHFEHEVNNGPVSQATQLYEQSLRYYQAGLEWAGSPYAFYSLGSCLAINAFDYAKVRGFPKRAGGEDFYLLNKLRKIGSIQHCDDIKVTIESRTSDRVPFGTGPAIQKILQLDDSHHYRYYHPLVFSELKTCLNGLNDLQPCRDFDSWRTALDQRHYHWLCDQGLERIFQHMLSQALDKQTLEQHIMAWFDGLMTLRFINFVRAEMHPDCYLTNALKNASFYKT